jgi:hypothetical protein
MEEEEEEEEEKKKRKEEKDDDDESSCTHEKLKLNSVAFSPRVNYTDRATAACRRS